MEASSSQRDAIDSKSRLILQYCHIKRQLPHLCENSKHCERPIATICHSVIDVRALCIVMDEMDL
jgi:hypothetical protein